MAKGELGLPCSTLITASVSWFGFNSHMKRVGCEWLEVTAIAGGISDVEVKLR